MDFGFSLGVCDPLLGSYLTPGRLLEATVTDCCFQQVPVEERR